MRATECVTLASNQTGALANQVGVQIYGGLYAVLAAGTLGSTPAIEMQSADGANWQTVATPSSTYGTVSLPPGLVRATLASGASGAYIKLDRIPYE
jgi:hypothetical protein